MVPISVTVGQVAASDVSVALAQNVVAATSLTLTAGAASLAYPAQLRIVTSADYTGINFTITGHIQRRCCWWCCVCWNDWQYVNPLGPYG